MSDRSFAGRAIRRLSRYAVELIKTLGQWLGRTLHPCLLRWTCIHLAPLWRKLRPPRPGGPPDQPRRVLHVTCSFDIGGVQRQIPALCQGSGDARLEHAAIEIFPEQNFVYRRGVRLRQEDYGGRGPFAARLARAVLDINARSQQMVQIYKLYRDFRRLKPDIVAGWGHEMAMLTFAAAAFARVPAIVFCIRTWNPSLGWTAIPRLLFKAHRRMVPWTNAVIVNSTPLQRDYAAWLGIRPGRVRVCPNGIDAVPFDTGAAALFRRDVRERMSIPGSALVLLNVGRFSTEKGQLLFLRAYERLVRESDRGDLYAVLCGDGPLLGQARAFAARRGLAGVRFPGRIENVPAFLWASDIYVMPSDFEGMPNAMMEAMAFGLPCVSTNRSGALDIARDRREALFVDVGDEAGLTDRLFELVRNPDERRRLGENARLRMAEFTVEKMVVRFNRIVADAAPRRP